MTRDEQRQAYKQSRASFAHSEARLRQGNALYEKTAPVTEAFETERCLYSAAQRRDVSKSEAQRRRESAMIKRQQPKHNLRPPRALAMGPDRTAFNAQMRQDNEQALRATLKEAYRANRRRDRTSRQADGRFHSFFQKHSRG